MTQINDATDTVRLYRHMSPPRRRPLYSSGLEKWIANRWYWVHQGKVYTRFPCCTQSLRVHSDLFDAEADLISAGYVLQSEEVCRDET